MLTRAALGLGLLAVVVSFSASSAQDQPKSSEKPRVFITDSQSWDISSYGGGGAGGGGSMTRGGARPQTAEIIKTFGQRCPEVVTNNIVQKSDYVVVLDHEGGKGFARHKNKIAVFARLSGDSVMSKSTVSLGGSVQDACEAITKDWEIHGASMRAAASDATAPSAAPAAVPRPTPAAAPVGPAVVPLPTTGKLLVASTPDGAEIEVDGSFVGNAPSQLQLADGDHTVALKKQGFKDWERHLKVTAGSDVHLDVELEKLDSQSSAEAVPK
jgi:hypothetical protein